MSVEAHRQTMRVNNKIAIVAKVASHRCPIAGCDKKWLALDSLFGHLFEQHRKNEIIAALIDALGL